MSREMSICVAFVELIEKVKLSEDTFFATPGVDGLHHAGICMPHQVAILFAGQACFAKFSVVGRAEIVTGELKVRPSQ